MNPRVMQEFGRAQRLQILNAIKRSEGLSINELTARLGRSYMGIKQHCVALHQSGYLDTRRRPKPRGRPEMVYRLTEKAHELFPETSNRVTLELLDAIRDAYGPNEPDKLLVNLLRRLEKKYERTVKGETPVDRARSLARLREREGYMSDLATMDGEEGMAIVEHHSPMIDLVLRYPIIGRLEREMFERLIGCPVRREATTHSGLYKAVFTLEAVPVPAGEVGPMLSALTL